MKGKDNTNILEELLEEAKIAPKRVYEPKPLALQLGLYIGDEIAYRHLPTLSTDMITGSKKKIITVSEEDTIEYKRLTDIWSKKNLETLDSNKEWNAHLLNMKFLEGKYLPKTIEIILSRLSWFNDEELTLIKKGIERSLWNCDFCNYKCSPDDIKIENYHEYYTKIILEVDLSYTLAKE